LIDGGRIVAVKTGLPAEGTGVIDARDRLVLPRLINAHIQLRQTGLREITGSWIPAAYRMNIRGNLAPRYPPEHLCLGTRDRRARPNRRPDDPRIRSVPRQRDARSQRPTDR
jgi:hypothetical protein